MAPVRRDKQIAFADEFPAPFTVQWAASVGSSGAWIIWLPLGANSLVYLDGKEVSSGFDELEAAEGYPAGWYILPEDAVSTEEGYSDLILYIKLDDNPSVSFTNESASEEGVIKVKICEVLNDSVTGEKKVWQAVTSAIIVSTSESLRSRPFDIETRAETVDGVTYDVRYIVRCWFVSGDNVMQYLEDYKLPDNGTVYLIGYRSAPDEDGVLPSWEFSMGTSTPSASGEEKVFAIPLYDVVDGVVTVDYRSTFLTVPSPAEVWSKKQIEVITGAELVVEDGAIKLRLQKKKIWAVNEIEEMETEILSAELAKKTVSVLTNVSYNADGAYTFIATRRDVKVIDTDGDPSGFDVFQTTPHSQET